MLESLFNLFRSRRQRLKSLALNAVFEDSRGARMITDIGGDVVVHNERMEELCRDRDGVSLNCIRTLFVDADAFDAVRRSGEKGDADQVETKAVLNGQEKWVMLSVMPVTDVAGLLHWRINDITARKSLETIIREERERLADFTDNAPLGFYTVDDRGGFTYVNATLARWLDEDPQDVLHKNLHDIFDRLPDDLAPTEVPEDGRLKRKTNVPLPVSVLQQGARGIVSDRTNERRMQSALQQSEDRFKVFFDEAPLGIALINRKGMLLDANPRLDVLLDSGTQIASGQPLANFIDEGESKALFDQFLQGLVSGTVPERAVDLTLKTADGSLPVQMFARLLPDRNSAVLHFIDLSEQKKLETQFAQSQKMQAVGQLAGGIAHDFNNLLTAMIGFCDLLLLRHKPSDASFADVMQIKQNANRAANLVRQLLAFSRQQTLKPVTLDPSEVLTELSHLMRRLLGPNIDLNIVHDPDLGFVKADQGQFEQVMINLAVNARDAMEGDGALEITMARLHTDRPMVRGADEMPAGEWSTIAVADTGCGMPPEIMARIFDPFFTTKAVGAGTGLGLATVYGIMRQTGGFIHVDSEVDKGTLFTLYFPRHAEREQAQIAQTAEIVADLTGTAHIVLVEDEDAVRSFSTRALANKGYKVTSFPDGVEALAWLEEQDGPPDLLITDVIMPEVDGPTLAQKVRTKYPALKVVFVSGYTEDKFKKQLGEDVHFLPKPFSLQQLAAKVKEVLG